MSRPRTSLNRAAKSFALLFAFAVNAALFIAFSSSRPALAESSSAAAISRRSALEEGRQRPSIDARPRFDSATIAAPRDELGENEAPSRTRSSSRAQPAFWCDSERFYSVVHANALATTTRTPRAPSVIFFRKRIPRFSSDEPP